MRLFTPDKFAVVNTRMLNILNALNSIMEDAGGSQRTSIIAGCLTHQVD